jgi:multiple sugar transport system permease protein
MTGRRRQDWLGYLFVAPYLLLFGAFLVGPLLYGLRLSLFRWEMLNATPPTFIGLGNYREAFSDPNFWKALWATLRMVVWITPCTVLLALFTALGLHSLRGRRQGLYRAAYFVPTMLTITVVGILWRWFYHPDLGLFNSCLQAWFGLKAPWFSDAAWATAAIVIMTVWWTMGGPMVILLAGLQGVPVQYAEAATLDGAGPLQRLWYVTLPILRPVLLFTVALNTIGAFQIFGQTYLVTRGGPEYATRTLVHLIYDTAFQNYRLGYAAALSWLMFLLIGAFAVMQFRMLRER